MWRHEGAGIVAFSTIVTEVGKVRDIAPLEICSAFHRRSDGAVSLTVPTRIADLELAISFFGCIRQALQPLHLLFSQMWFRSSNQNQPSILWSICYLP